MRSNLRYGAAVLCWLVAIAAGMAASPSYGLLLSVSLGCTLLYGVLVYQLWKAASARKRVVIGVVSLPLLVLATESARRVLFMLLYTG
jgi:hypothetical protein